MSKPLFSGCTKGSYCSDQIRTNVGTNNTGIFHRTVTTLTGQGPAYSGAKTETYIIAKNEAGIDTWVLAATTTDGGKTQVFNEATRTTDGSKFVGADVRASLAPGGNMSKNISKQVQDTLASGGRPQGLITLPGTSGSLEKITPAQQQKIGVVPPSTAIDPGGAGTAKSGPDIPFIGYEPTDENQNAVAGKFGKRLQYPFEMDPTQDKIQFLAVEMKKSVLGGVGAGGTITKLSSFQAPVNSYVKVDAPVFLGIQNGINDQCTVSWGEGSLTALEALAFTSARKLMSSGENTSETLGDIGSDIFKAADTSKPQILDIFGGEAASVQNILARTQGMVMNPNMELLFQGPQLRPFTFQFKMSARNPDEATAIKTIIKYFKRHMAVRRVSGNIFLKAPHVFTIRYFKGETTHNSINLISPDDLLKACALTSCTVDYTPNGSYMTYEDPSATMAAYTLNLQFQELEPVYADDYDSIDHPIGY